MKILTYFFVLLAVIITTGCGLPKEGEIIENKLTMERYEVIAEGSYQSVLQTAKIIKDINQTLIDSTGSTSRYTPLTYITNSNSEDSLNNPNAILVEEKVMSKYYPNIDKTAYIQGLTIITSEEFQKKYKVVN